MSDLAILYIGSLTPELTGSGKATLTAAGEVFQRSLLSALTSLEGSSVDAITYVQVVSFPKEKLFVRGRDTKTPDGLKCRTLGHINLGPIKIITLALTGAAQAVKWSWRNRRTKQRVALLYNLNAPHIAIVRPICQLFGTKLVPVVCDILVPGEVVGNGLLRKIDFRLQTRSLPKADGRIVINQSIIDDFAPGQHRMLLDGGILTRFLDRFQSKQPLSGTPFCIVFAGLLVEANGINLILEALQLLPGVDLKLIIAGRGPHADAVSRAAAEDPRVDFLGSLSHEEVLDLYQKADLLLSLRGEVMRTDRYVFPSKVVECLATARPLLVTPMGHIVKEFGSFVYVLEERTPEALAEKFRSIIDIPEPERLEMGRRAKEFVRNHRTWEANAERILTYLKKDVLQDRR